MVETKFNQYQYKLSYIESLYFSRSGTLIFLHFNSNFNSKPQMYKLNFSFKTKLAFLLFLMPFSIEASAPFGLSWGDNLNRYGEVVESQKELIVKTELLPKPLSIANHYILSGQQELGLLQVSMISKQYYIYDVLFKEYFHFLKNSLSEIGYQTLKFIPSEVHSYKCILQGSCNGKRWYAEFNDGSTVMIKQIIENDKTGSFLLIFKSPQQVIIEAELKDELTLKAQNIRTSDKSALN